MIPRILDNIAILHEAVCKGRPILIGDTEKCDMTREEYLTACIPAAVTIERSELTADRKAAFTWLR